MKNFKIILLGIIITISLIIIDTFQALILNNSTILKRRIYYNDVPVKYVDKGILVDTYHCHDGIKETILKGNKYSCGESIGFTIVDKFDKGMVCAEALEEIYEDKKYTYYLSCMKSEYIEVRYDNFKKENIVEALKSGHIKITDLDKFNISYYKYEK